MENKINRLLMEFERQLREANREHINPAIKELSMQDLRPLAALVARARAEYLHFLFDLSQKYQDQDTLPSDTEIQKLGQLRSCFISLVEGSKSFETAIQRGYLDLDTGAAAT